MPHSPSPHPLHLPRIPPRHDLKFNSLRCYRRNKHFCRPNIFYLQCRGVDSSASRGFTVQSFIALKQNAAKLFISGRAETGAWTQAWRLKQLTWSGGSTGSAPPSAALPFCASSRAPRGAVSFKSGRLLLCAAFLDRGDKGLSFGRSDGTCLSLK